MHIPELISSVCLCAHTHLESQPELGGRCGSVHTAFTEVSLRIGDTLCGMAYPLYIALRRHAVLKHNSNFDAVLYGKPDAEPVDCPYCELVAFTRPEVLRLHLSKIHPDQVQQQAVVAAVASALGPEEDDLNDKDWTGSSSSKSTERKTKGRPFCVGTVVLDPISSCCWMNRMSRIVAAIGSEFLAYVNPVLVPLSQAVNCCETHPFDVRLDNFEPRLQLTAILLPTVCIARRNISDAGNGSSENRVLIVDFKAGNICPSWSCRLIGIDDYPGSLWVMLAKLSSFENTEEICSTSHLCETTGLLPVDTGLITNQPILC
ncbi:unnamed protein product [Dibothriocephalus latus]|uniref:Uncharacterized protein n=1 Tax=Dibothriocephalus latus TaxID=60516 RepID=A0A3P7QUR6_DIBLA|nr:unnamed protein product [Dibothriocephalus latus]